VPVWVFDAVEGLRRGVLRFCRHVELPQDTKDRIAAVCERQPGVELALLFGSAARGTATESSDVDLAVRGRGVDLLALRAALVEVLEREVDVVLLDDPSIPLMEVLIRDGVVVYESAPGVGASWRATTLMMLETDRPWYARMRNAWLRRVADEGI
jgi:predicted nucleotidyltransferase